ncbi:MAG TPA: nucleotidyltransferase domain-containing protein [Methanocorpusculum sp.]|nr:nucleotidyltransferase domain-containing protein [Methanocorpusculum sp.]
MSEYLSIREDVLRKLEANLPEIRERFGIETLGIFGSVSRGEDTPDSDVDILYDFQQGKGNMHSFSHFTEYIEDLLGRTADFVSLKWATPQFRHYVEKDMILLGDSSA